MAFDNLGQKLSSDDLRKHVKNILISTIGSDPSPKDIRDTLRSKLEIQVNVWEVEEALSIIKYRQRKNKRRRQKQKKNPGEVRGAVSLKQYLNLRGLIWD